MVVRASVRERRRADTVREIKAAALQQLGEGGSGTLSLRGVGRHVGMTVQSLYHYFAGRDALLAALVEDAAAALGAAVAAAAQESSGRPALERRVAVACAFRDWAMSNRPAFLLLSGSATLWLPTTGSIVAGGRHSPLTAPFVEVLFDGWSPAELAAVPLPADMAPPGWDGHEIALPIGAFTLFVELRVRILGLVVADLLGGLHPDGDVAELLFAVAMRRLSDDVDSARAAAMRPATLAWGARRTAAAPPNPAPAVA